MNKKAFEKILEEKKIYPIDMVKITIINPHKKIWEFWKQNLLSFEGSIGYKKGDNMIDLCTLDPNDSFKPIFLYFDIEQIIVIKKLQKY